MNFNLAVILRETAAAWPDRPVALYPGGRLSYAELDALSDRLKCGGIAVPLNVMLKATEAAFQPADPAATMLITWAGILDEAAKGAAAGVGAVYAAGQQPAAGQPADGVAP